MSFQSRRVIIVDALNLMSATESSKLTFEWDSFVPTFPAQLPPYAIRSDFFCFLPTLVARIVLTFVNFHLNFSSAYFSDFSHEILSRESNLFLSSHHPHPTPDTNHVDKCLTHDIAFKFRKEKIWKLLFIKKSFSLSFSRCLLLLSKHPSDSF